MFGDEPTYPLLLARVSVARVSAAELLREAGSVACVSAAEALLGLAWAVKAG